MRATRPSWCSSEGSSCGRRRTGATSICGICGIVDYSGPAPERAALEAMVRAIRHRGPDDADVAVLGPAGLGHARLSIIDLTPTGHQPMLAPDGQVAVVYNGEVYNFPEIRARLEGLGVTFRGTSDTEVVLHAYLHWGSSCFAMLNGMYGLAIWDNRDRRLWLVRDRFGIKPIYYQRLTHGIVFGSEIKAILAAGRLTPGISLKGLHEFLYFGNALGATTLFEGVHEVLPGHFLCLDEQGVRTEAYWSVEHVPQIHPDEPTARRRVLELLEQAVAAHLISDVPVGVFLSGGIDSSAIVALAVRHYRGKLKTFSVGFDFSYYGDELPKARLVAERFGTEHREMHVAGIDMADLIERMVHCHDEPFADPADIPLYLLCAQLGGDVKVVLQGDGGDEIFGGYRRYNAYSFATWWKLAARVAVPLNFLRPVSPRSDRAMRFFRLMLEKDPALRTALLLTSETLHEPPTRVLAAEWRQALQATDPFARYREVYGRIRSLDDVQQLLYTDASIMMPDTYFEKVDKSTMAHGIEVRVPYLDRDLTEYVMGLPSSMKVSGGQKKRVLRAALRGVVPDEILDAPKQGFGVPYNFWLRGPLHGYLKSVLLDPATLAVGLLDRPTVETLIAEHGSGRRDHGFILYKLLHLALWHKAYLDGRPVPSPTSSPRATADA